jgi:hypothetical protein
MNVLATEHALRKCCWVDHHRHVEPISIITITPPFLLSSSSSSSSDNFKLQILRPYFAILWNGPQIYKIVHTQKPKPLPPLFLGLFAHEHGYGCGSQGLHSAVLLPDVVCGYGLYQLIWSKRIRKQHSKIVSTPRRIPIDHPQRSATSFPVLVSAPLFNTDGLLRNLQDDNNHIHIHIQRSTPPYSSSAKYCAAIVCNPYAFETL